MAVPLVCFRSLDTSGGVGAGFDLRIDDDLLRLVALSVDVFFTAACSLLSSFFLITLTKLGEVSLPSAAPLSDFVLAVSDVACAFLEGLELVISAGELSEGVDLVIFAVEAVTAFFTAAGCLTTSGSDFGLSAVSLLVDVSSIVDA